MDVRACVGPLVDPREQDVRPLPGVLQHLDPELGTVRGSPADRPGLFRVLEGDLPRRYIPEKCHRLGRGTPLTVRGAHVHFTPR